MKIVSCFVPLLLAATALSGCATEPERRPPRSGQGGGGFEGIAAKPIALLFVSMDANQNKIVSGEELISGIEREWTELYQNTAVGAFEYNVWAAATLGAEDALPSFISFDRNLDGRLSDTEFDDRLRMEFFELDKNKDGALDRAELTFRVARRSRNEGREEGGRGRGGEEGGRRRQPR